MAKRLYVVDTCSFAEQFKQPECARLMNTLIARGQFLLSAIVAMELYAHTRDHPSKKTLDTLGLELEKAGLLIVPEYRDYQRAGLLLRNYSRKKGAVQSSTHFRDILICLAASRIGAAVITENQGDFTRWAIEIKHAFHKEVTVHSYRDLL